jgi:hypothetical protein
MTAMFPDSGVPPADAKNSLPNPDTKNCNELWYSTSRCQPRFDPAAANAMLAEQINLINKAEVSYDCQYLDQVEHAVRYLIQRGLPCGAPSAGGPADFTLTLDPPLTRYNDHLTLVVVPNVNNNGPVRINVNGRGLVSVLRNDGLALQAGDWFANRPLVISYWKGAFYMVGLSASQVPIVAVGAVNIWIRTDGNDETGDGSANTPDKAFKTIQGAWNKVGGRYAATPLFSINMRLGIPSTYAGARIGGFGGNVALVGDAGNRGGYRISSVFSGNNAYVNFTLSSIGSMYFHGITFQLDVGPPYQDFAVYGMQANFSFNECSFDVLINNPLHMFMNISGGGAGSAAGNYYFNGNGHVIGGYIFANGGGTWGGCGSDQGAVFHFSNAIIDGSQGGGGMNQRLRHYQLVTVVNHRDFRRHRTKVHNPDQLGFGWQQPDLAGGCGRRDDDRRSVRPIRRMPCQIQWKHCALI